MNNSPNQRHRLLTDTLAMLRDGKVNDEAGRELNRVIAAVEATGKPAELVIKLKVAPAAKNSEMVKVDSVIEAKVPKSDIAPSIFYVDSNKNLSAEDPNARTKGPVRDVNAQAPVELREVAGNA